MRIIRITTPLKVFALLVSCLAVLTLNRLSAQAATKPTSKKAAAQPTTPSNKEKKPVAQPATPSNKEKKSVAQPRIPIRVVSHNVAKKRAAIDKAVSVANNLDAHVIALQEVCPNDYAKFLADHSDWSIGAVLQNRPAYDGFCSKPDDEPKMVIAFRGNASVKPYLLFDLPQPADSKFHHPPGSEMVCVHFTRNTVPVDACSVHLAVGDWKDESTGNLYTGAALRAEEVKTIKSVTKGWIGQGHFVVIAGDFNANPDHPEMDMLYTPKIPGGGTGSFTEYNRLSGSRYDKFTAGNRKIDYIFFSISRAQLDGDFSIVMDPKSDHRLITSTAQMKLE